jgi:hypothetical protein
MCMSMNPAMKFIDCQTGHGKEEEGEGRGRRQGS